MPFMIFDQGARLVVPVEQLWLGRQVLPVHGVDPIQSVKAHEFVAGDLPHQRSLQGYEQAPDAERKRVRIAGDIMNRSLLTVSAEDFQLRAWQIFHAHDFRHIPVVDDGNRVQGILSDRDILKHYNPGERISTIMQPRVITATADTEIRILAGGMVRYHIGAVPIVDTTDQLLGLVTRTDILRVMVNEAPLELWV